MAEQAEIENLSVFQDCLSTTLIQRLAPSTSKGSKKRIKGRKNEIKPVTTQTGPEDEASELADFIEVRVSSFTQRTAQAETRSVSR